MDKERLKELEENSCNAYIFFIESMKLNSAQIHSLDYVIDTALEYREFSEDKKN
jgi:hypothetical protein